MNDSEELRLAHLAAQRKVSALEKKQEELRAELVKTQRALDEAVMQEWAAGLAARA